MPRRLPFMLVALIVVLLAVPAGVIWPTMQQLRAISTAIYREYEFLEAKSQRGQDIRRARREYEAVEAELPMLRALAVEPGGELAFVTAIEALAEEVGVAETIQLDTERVKTAGGYRLLPVELTVRGPYPAVVRYLLALQTLPTVTSFSTVTMQLGRTAGGLPSRDEGRVEARLTGSVAEHLTTPNEP